MPPVSRRSGPPLLSPRGAAFALGAALLLLWPMALVTAPLVYFDSFAYADAGERAFALLRLLLMPDAAQGGGGAAAAGGGEGLGSLRSASWSVFVAALGGMPWGLVAACALQTAATLFVLGALVPEGASPRRGRAILGAAAVGVLSGLPWYASYAMPDILGALVVGYYAALPLIVGRVPHRTLALLGALACFAILSHYGHLPLAAGLAGLILLWRVRHLSAALVAATLAPDPMAVP